MKLSEKDFQQQIIELARIYGWRVHAERPGMMQSGNWVTPIQGDRGWPDLALVKGKHILFAELKSGEGRVTQEQQEWLDALKRVTPDVYVWRPADWETIQEIITGE